MWLRPRTSMDVSRESAILWGVMKSHDRPSPPDYGIMFNHDGTFLGKSEYPQRIDDLLDKIYGPLQDTQIGALLWCVGAEQARWPSDNLESVVDPRERPYGSVKEFRRAESVRAMFDRGEDLYGDMVRRGHDLGMDVYVSIRMNDNHFWSDSARKAFPLAPEEMAQDRSTGAHAVPQGPPGVGARHRQRATMGGNVVEHGDSRGAGVHTAPHSGGLYARGLGRR